MEKLQNQKQLTTNQTNQKETDYSVRKSSVQQKTENVLVVNIRKLETKVLFVKDVELKLLHLQLEETD